MSIDTPVVEAFMEHIDKAFASSWRVAPQIIKCWMPGLPVQYKCDECDKATHSYAILKNHGCENKYDEVIV